MILNIIRQEVKMASQSTGIQQLLKAEKTAADKVAEARKRKNRRLKQAKEEAQAEIDNYKAQREKQYKRYEQSVLGSRGDMETKIDINTKQKIEEISAGVKKNKEQAIKELLDLVLEIKPLVHKNLVPKV
ncbi:V-type proton ATPase subunit G 1-like [Mizuhopecten yessoensis]|uniref:V-type proton ATPase subunit G n=1 Tax=Mizuhopecten yessoensis TaxID=6573 RepID=A0A210PH61_MIZYE|nr:V-type proton ATPase subunit G 1-like [Mizuhopecten yessoensis]OWF35825.1 V-type proton ATPase subunit G 1 [Mizuhopecten yessoensis]